MALRPADVRVEQAGDRQGVVPHELRLEPARDSGWRAGGCSGRSRAVRARSCALLPIGRATSQCSLTMCFTSQPLSRNSTASQSSNSGCVGHSPCAPRSSTVALSPVPKHCFHRRFMKTRAVSGLSGETIQRARSSRVSRWPGSTAVGERKCGSPGSSNSPVSSCQFPRCSNRIGSGCGRASVTSTCACPWRHSAISRSNRSTAGKAFRSVPVLRSQAACTTGADAKSSRVSAARSAGSISGSRRSSGASGETERRTQARFTPSSTMCTSSPAESAAGLSSNQTAVLASCKCAGESAQPAFKPLIIAPPA